MLFDLRSLGYFVAAYEERSVTAASRRCFVAQPSISMAIKGLEDALETTLFERSRQGLAPTPAAHRLYPRACSLPGRVIAHFTPAKACSAVQCKTP